MFRGKKGFTLIELLVVIAIIAILAAILFPVFAQARGKARQAACLSNMKQMGLALNQYVQDYDETFPCVVYRAVAATNPTGLANYSYLVTLEPYLKSVDVTYCPSVQKSPATRTIWISGTYNSKVYGPGFDFLTGLICGFPPNLGGSCWLRINSPAATMASVKSPASVIAVFDSCLASTGNIGGGFWPMTFGNLVYLSDYGGGPYTPVHNGGATMAFADGHAKWYNMKNHPGYNMGNPTWPYPFYVTRWPERQIGFSIDYEP